MIFGASGDLASRDPCPALAEPRDAGQVPTDLRILDDVLHRLRDEPAEITHHAQVQLILVKAERPLLAHLR